MFLVRDYRAFREGRKEGRGRPGDGLVSLRAPNRKKLSLPLKGEEEKRKKKRRGSPL